MPATPPSAILTTPVPDLDEEEAAAILRDVFGRAGRMTRLSGERDSNFLAATAAGDSVVLKIANAAEARAVGAFQNAALRHVALAAPDMPVPRVCAALAGEDEPLVRLRAGTTHAVRLLTYLPGLPLHRTPASEAQTAGLGRCLAALGLALEEFDHPAAGRDLLWDLRRAGRLRPHLVHLAEVEMRGRATRVLDRFEAAVQPRLAGLRHQVVHNDFNPHNVLVEPHDPVRIAGVFDFGDLVRTALVNDVAIGASYQVAGPDPVGRLASFVAAYHGVRPLEEGEVEVLADLVMLRHAMSLTIASWRAGLYPENGAYLTRNQARAGAALRALETHGVARVTARLRRACGFG